MRELTEAEREAVLTSVGREVAIEFGSTWTPATPLHVEMADWGDKLRQELEDDPAGYCDHFDCACPPEKQV